MRSIAKLNRLTLIATLTTGMSLIPYAGSQVLVVTGDVEKPAHYSLEELQKLHEDRLKARDHGGEEAEYVGVNLNDLLDRSGAPLGEHLRGAALAKAVVIHATDGYQAVFSLAELDSAMTDRKTLLAWSRNNEALPASQGPLRLIVPRDKRQARWVKHVAAIEVVSVNRPAITNAVAPSATLSAGKQ